MSAMAVGMPVTLTLPVKNVSLAEWSNQSKENGNDEDGTKGALDARAGRLTGVDGKAVSAEQMEISRLRAELARNGGCFKFGSSTWARTRGLRIDRAQNPQTAWRTVRLDKSGCPARRPATEMSSSSASRCKPPLLSSTWARCSALAFSRRGNQANGVAMVRPSDRLTHMVSSSKRTALGEVFIPSPFDQTRVCCNHGPQVPQSTGIKTIAVGQINRWPQPEFCLAFAIPHMNMHGLTRVAFVRVEEKRNGLKRKTAGMVSSSSPATRLRVRLQPEPSAQPRQPRRAPSPATARHCFG
jgi:hypothetical protein